MGVIERLPGSGGKVRLESEHRLPGGQVATAVLAATRLGLRCALVGAVGDDEAAALALAPLRAAGVDTSRVRKHGSTRQAWVLVERVAGERTVFERPGTPLAADVLCAGTIGSARMLLLDLEHPEAAEAAAARAREVGVPVILDADRVSEEALRLAASVDFPIVSRAFAEELSSDASLEGALRQLSGPHTQAAVVTLGERGSLAWCEGRWLETPAPGVLVTDTTGAGDVFRGAFAWALVRGHRVPHALTLANRAAASSCRGLGAQGALPGADELEASS